MILELWGSPPVDIQGELFVFSSPCFFHKLQLAFILIHKYSSEGFEDRPEYD